MRIEVTCCKDCPFGDDEASAMMLNGTCAIGGVFSIENDEDPPPEGCPLEKHGQVTVSATYTVRQGWAKTREDDKEVREVIIHEHTFWADAGFRCWCGMTEKEHLALVEKFEEKERNVTTNQKVADAAAVHHLVNKVRAILDPSNAYEGLDTVDLAKKVRKGYEREAAEADRLAVDLLSAQRTCERLREERDAALVRLDSTDAPRTMIRGPFIFDLDKLHISLSGEPFVDDIYSDTVVAFKEELELLVAGTFPLHHNGHTFFVCCDWSVSDEFREELGKQAKRLYEWHRSAKT